MKRFVQFALLLLSVVVLFFVLLKKDKGVSYDDVCISDEELTALMDSHEESDELFTREIYFNDEKLFLDSNNGIFYYSLNANDKTAYNPTISVPKGYNIAILDNEITDESIASCLSTPFVLYNDRDYKRYYLRCTTLPMMEIYTSTGEEIDIDTVHVSMRMYDNSEGAINREVESTGKMHIRGATSLAYPKHNYRLKLTLESLGNNMRPNNISLLGMREDNDWLLYGAYNDGEKIRNVFCSNLWYESCAGHNVLAVNNGTQYKYFELIIDGSYRGLYALGYPMDSKQFGLNPDEKEYIFDKESWELESEVDFTEDGAVDGYGIDEQYDTDEAWRVLRDYYLCLLDSKTTAEEILSMVDLDNLIDVYLYVNFIQGADNGRPEAMKNMYLSSHFENDKLTMLYTPWDMDITFGAEWILEAPNHFYMYYYDPEYNIEMKNGPLYELMEREYEGIDEKISERYCELRNNQWSDQTISEKLDEYEAQIYDSGAYMRCMQTWEEESFSDPELKLTAFKEYVLARLNYLDMYYGYEK